MKAVEKLIETPTARRGKLLKILGVGFGLAVGIGATVGVGILRNPGGVAAQLGTPWLIMTAWLLGGVFCLLGANHLTELATMIPKAGGFYVYAERAFGRYGGFVVGWSSWLNDTLGLSFVSVVFGEYAAQLFAPDLYGGRIIFSVSILVIITTLNLIGVRAGSETQKITSFLKAVALVAFVAACFIFGGQTNLAEAAQTVAAPVCIRIVARRFHFGFPTHSRNLRRLVYADLFFRRRHQSAAKSTALNLRRHRRYQRHLPARQSRFAIRFADVAACRFKICGRRRDEPDFRRKRRSNFIDSRAAFDYRHHQRFDNGNSAHDVRSRTRRTFYQASRADQ